MKRFLIELIVTLAVLNMTSCKKTSIEVSSLMGLEKTVWVGNGSKSDIAIFSNGGLSFFMSYDRDLNKFLGKDGTYTYTNPQFTVNIDGESTSGIVSADGSTMSYSDGENVVSYVRMVSSVTALEGTSWTSTGISGASFTLTFTKGEFALTFVIVVPGSQPETVSGYYQYQNPLCVLATNAEVGASSYCVGFLTGDGEMLVLVDEDGNTLNMVPQK